MMGVLGAEFGQEMEPSHAKKTTNDTHKKQRPVEGFEITNYSHARHTSKWILLYHYQYTTINIPLSIYHYQYTTINIPLSIYHYQYTTINIPLSIYHYQYTTIKIPLSIYHYHSMLSCFHSCRMLYLHLIAHSSPTLF